MNGRAIEPPHKRQKLGTPHAAQGREQAAAAAAVGKQGKAVQAHKPPAQPAGKGHAPANAAHHRPDLEAQRPAPQRGGGAAQPQQEQRHKRKKGQTDAASERAPLAGSKAAVHQAAPAGDAQRKLAPHATKGGPSAQAAVAPAARPKAVPGAAAAAGSSAGQLDAKKQKPPPPAMLIRKGAAPVNSNWATMQAVRPPLRCSLACSL